VIGHAEALTGAELQRELYDGQWIVVDSQLVERLSRMNQGGEAKKHSHREMAPTLGNLGKNCQDLRRSRRSAQRNPERDLLALQHGRVRNAN
jgi:hypothetical protein